MATSTSKPTVIDELEILETTIVKLDVPHRAIASAEKPRAVVSIKFIGNPVLI